MNRSSKTFAMLTLMAFLVPLGMSAPLLPEPCPPAPAALCQLLPVILGDDTVEDGEHRRHDNKTFTMIGKIEVESGGTFELDNATVAFAASSDGIHIQTGGTLRIMESQLTGPLGDNTTSLIQVDAGSTLIVSRSSLEGFTLETASNASQIDWNMFLGSALALVLKDVTATVELNEFHGNEISINITGGSPTIIDGYFAGGNTHITIADGSPTIQDNTMVDSMFGILGFGAGGTYQANSMSDMSQPPSRGIVLEDCPPGTEVIDNSLTDWGIAILLINCSPTSSGNYFNNNGQNTVSM